MIRYCNFCGHIIRQERIKRNLRVRFCSDSCRFADRNERRRLREAQQRKEGGNTRVHVASVGGGK